MMESLLLSCALCTLCKNGGYQSPPTLFLGRLPKAPIVIVGQNPGEINKDRDPFRFEMGQAMHNLRELNALSQSVVYEWYNADFVTSKCYATLSRILGDDWLKGEQFLFTNAVRCRTIKNEAPDGEMITNCSSWTRILIERPVVKAVVFMGKIAIQQTLGDDAEKLNFGAIKRNSRNGKLYAAIKHYAAWNSEDETIAKDVFGRILDSLK